MDLAAAAEPSAACNCASPVPIKASCAPIDRSFGKVSTSRSEALLPGQATDNPEQQAIGIDFQPHATLQRFLVDRALGQRIDREPAFEQLVGRRVPDTGIDTV